MDTCKRCAREGRGVQNLSLHSFSFDQVVVAFTTICPQCDNKATTHIPLIWIEAVTGKLPPFDDKTGDTDRRGITYS